MLNDSNDLPDGRSKFVGIVYQPAFAIKNYISFVCNELRASFQPSDFRTDSQVQQFSHDDGGRHWNHFDGQRKLPELTDDLAGVGHNDETPGSAGHNLLAEQRPAPTLDQRKPGGDLIRSINGYVNFGAGIEVDNRDGQRCREFLARF